MHCFREAQSSFSEAFEMLLITLLEGIFVVEVGKVGAHTMDNGDVE